MWYPPPPVEPPVFELHSATYEELCARPMWQVIPFDQMLNFLDISQGFRNAPLYTDDGRKYVLMRSLFKLVRNNNYLELTNPKLHGWFRYLTIEDRILIQQEGGLLQFLSKHPALEVAGQFVYVKPKVRGKGYPPTMPSDMSRYPTFYGASQCQNCGASCLFGTQKCSCCGVHLAISEDRGVKEVYVSGCIQNSINPIGTQRCGHRSPAAHPPFGSKRMCPHTQSQWGKVENTKHFKDTAAQASFSLDMELDIQSQVQKNVYTQNDQDHTCNQEVTSPEYYSFSSTSLDQNTWSDGSRSTEAGYMDSITATKGSTELSGEISDAANASASANTTNCFSCLSNSFELTEESGDAHEDLQKKHDSSHEQEMEERNVGSALKPKSRAFVDQIIDACGDFRACFTSTCATEVGQLFQVKNVATDTDLLAVSHEKESQTVQMVTSDKNIITEVYMTDLDDLTEEFIKLKDMEKELKQLKSKQASSSSDGDHGRRVCGCDCAQRVRRTELSLLALQYFMCQQHCWRCCFTSPLGESAYDRTEALPDSIANTLKKLQKDYNEMRRLILEGTSLDELKPLSVNTENITTGTNYSPASVLEAHLNSYDCPGRAECSITHGHGVDEECKETRTLDAEACDDTDASLEKAKDEGSRREKTLVLTHNQPGASPETNPGSIKDPNASEAWFDAEEELGFPNQDGKMEKQNKWRKRTNEDESKLSSLLCITSLPDNITENELLVWCKKYNATNACISSFSNNMRTAVVYLRSPSDAKAAVKDLNGHSLQGHTVQVVQLCGPAKPKPNDPSHSTPETHEAETAGDGSGTKSVTCSPSHGGPRCSVDRLTNVCDLPTASGTCVPQHYATMGSFDTIMARLLERHPNISRQRIIDALLELRAKHQGFLSGLSLRSIVEMTSELLTQDSTPT